MQRENAQAQKRKAESTDASVRGGPLRSSDEAAVMAVERRGWAVQFRLGQPATGGTLTLGRKAPAFQGVHEPDDARASRPESVSGWRCNSSGRLGSRRSGAGSKPLRAAGVKSVGGERRRKRREENLSGEIWRGERERTIDDVPKSIGRCRNRGKVVAPGMSLGG